MYYDISKVSMKHIAEINQMMDSNASDESIIKKLSDRLLPDEVLSTITFIRESSK
jgi:hypothetical protein